MSARPATSSPITPVHLPVLLFDVATTTCCAIGTIHLEARERFLWSTIDSSASHLQRCFIPQELNAFWDEVPGMIGWLHRREGI